MTARRRIVPGYFRDPAEWARLAADPRVAEVIVNADSGPGTEPLPYIAQVMAEAPERGIRVAVYVATGAEVVPGVREYGAKPLDAILDEVDRWRRFYGRSAARDVFYDEVPGHAPLGWLRPLNHRARYPLGKAFGKASGRAIFNPGANGVTRPTMIALSDSVWCRWEGPGWAYLAQRPRSLFLPSRTLHLVHSVTDAERPQVLSWSNRAAGLSYVTSDGPDGNPWTEYDQR